jgi:RNA polymerase sigma factor for flagellar operon FliA
MELQLMSLDTHQHLNAATTEADASNDFRMPASAKTDEPLVLYHLSLVRRIARGVARRLPRHVEIEDLVQAGMLGLLEAAQRYHASASSFETYAKYRIRGAILDSVRKFDWRPRSLHRRLRDIDTAKCRIENETVATARAADVAAALGWSNEVYHRTIKDAAAIPLLSLDDPGLVDGRVEYDTSFDDSANPASKLEKSDLRREMAAALDALPENERVILLLYYDEGCCLREIGNRFELSESRICQILGQAVGRLRVSMLAVEAGEDSPANHRRLRRASRSHDSRRSSDEFSRRWEKIIRRQ